MRVKLDKYGIGKIRELCEKRVNAVKQRCALEAMDYLLHFGYHAVWPCGPHKESPGWSYYYAANWNVSVSTVDTSVLTPERDPFDEKHAAYKFDLDAKRSSLMVSEVVKSDVEKDIYVTNSVYYGKWLNEGGVSFLTYNTLSQPNRFIELCTTHLNTSVDGIIKEVKKNIK